MDDKLNIRYFRNVSITISWITAALFYYWLAFPVANMQFENMGPAGIPIDHRYGITWWVVFPVLFTGLLPLLLLWIMTRPTSLFRVDFHLLIIVIVLLATAICALGALFIGWFWCSTIVSGPAAGCNSYYYCCNYAISVPEQCPFPIGSCSPAAPAVLGWTFEWTQHFWITLVFFFLTFVYWSINYDLRVSGLSTASDLREAIIIALVVLFGSTIVFYWFIAFVVPNLNFTNGYPIFDIDPPGPFISSLYKLQWIVVYLLHVNVLPIVLLAVALVSSTSHEFYTKFHLRVCSYFVAIVDVAVLLVIIFVWIFNTNDWPFNSALSISNSDEYCCERFADNPLICPNVAPCVAPTPRNLHANPMFVNLFISNVCFCIVVTVHIIMNSRFVAYKLLVSK